MAHAPSNQMAFRGGNNRNNRNFGGNFGGGAMGGGGGGNRNMNPWDNQAGGGGNYGNMRQGGGGGGGGPGMNAETLSLANNLLNNLLRNQNPPSLLDLPRGGGGMGGNRNQRGLMGNRVGGGIGGGGGINRNRRPQGGFVRGGQKPGSNKQGGGIRKQNAFDRAKKLLAKNSNKKKDSASGDKTDNSKKTESVKESIYADVPNDMFYCHLCKKHMWDSNSFENHIKGRTHLMMREGIEESYRLKANMIRQEAKIAEQLKSIELDRLKRMGKSGKNRLLEYCTMCDLNFHGHLSAHRKSDGHLQLKKFLHPKCGECNREFPTRIEYDTHLLAPDHLKRAAEKNTKVGETQKKTLTILTEEDELRDIRPPQKKKKKVAPVKKEGEEGAEEKIDDKDNGEAVEGEEIKKEEGDESAAADEAKEGDELNETKDEEEEEVPLAEDPEDCILDFVDGEEVPIEVDARLPKYNWTRPVGTSLIAKLECIECSLCGKFFDTEKTAEIHSRTVSHHRQFLKFINEKSSDTKIAQKRAAAALEETERKKKKLEEDANADAEIKEEGNDELYDPSEATGDDEDVEMAENGEAAAEDANGEDIKAEEAEEEQMDAQDTEEAAPVVEEPKPVVEAPAPVVEAPKPVETKPAPATPTTPAPATPVAAAPATPTPAPAPAPAAATPTASPQKKNTPARGAAAKATPRGRGRGRYNRY